MYFIIIACILALLILVIFLLVLKDRPNLNIDSSIKLIGFSFSLKVSGDSDNACAKLPPKAPSDEGAGSALAETEGENP